MCLIGLAKNHSLRAASVKRIIKSRLNRQIILYTILHKLLEKNEPLFSSFFPFKTYTFSISAYNSWGWQELFKRCNNIGPLLSLIAAGVGYLLIQFSGKVKRVNKYCFRIL